jgi:hypothetical protein
MMYRAVYQAENEWHQYQQDTEDIEELYTELLGTFQKRQIDKEETPVQIYDDKGRACINEHDNLIRDPKDRC